MARPLTILESTFSYPTLEPITYNQIRRINQSGLIAPIQAIQKILQYIHTLNHAGENMHKCVSELNDQLNALVSVWVVLSPWKLTWFENPHTEVVYQLNAHLLYWREKLRQAHYAYIWYESLHFLGQNKLAHAMAEDILFSFVKNLVIELEQSFSCFGDSIAVTHDTQNSYAVIMQQSSS